MWGSQARKTVSTNVAWFVFFVAISLEWLACEQSIAEISLCLIAWLQANWRNSMKYFCSFGNNKQDQHHFFSFFYSERMLCANYNVKRTILQGVNKTWRISEHYVNVEYGWNVYMPIGLEPFSWNIVWANYLWNHQIFIVYYILFIIFQYSKVHVIHYHKLNEFKIVKIYTWLYLSLPKHWKCSLETIM